MFWLFQLERRICGILCCMLCLGPILVVVGVFVLASSTHDSRGAAITQFNTAVDDWTNTYRSQFTVLNNVSVVVNNVRYYATVSDTPDAYSDHDDKLKTYTPLKYVIPLSSIFGTRVWSLYNNSFQGTFYNSSKYITSDTLALTLTTTIYVSDCKTTDTFCTECNNKMGSWSAGVCTGKQALSGYCIKMDNSTSIWGPSGTGAQIGCGAGGNWNTNSYSTIPYSTTSYSYNGQFVIRSAHDPYVVAAQITGGTFNFGLSRKQKAEIGFILIIVGGACMVPIILISVLCYRHLAKKHNHHHHHHYHHGGGYQSIHS